MFSKVMIPVLIAAIVSLASGAYNGPLAGGQPAAQYPAGIDPKSCPNFPDCSSPLVALSKATSLPGVQYDLAQQYQHYQNVAPQQTHPQYAVAPQFNSNPQYVPQQAQSRYSPEIQNALDRGEYIGDGDYHGEGLAESMDIKPITNNAVQYNQQPQVQNYAQPQAPAYQQAYVRPQAQAYAQPQFQAYNQPQAPAYAHQQAQAYAQPQSRGFAQPQGQYRENIQRGPSHQLPAGVDASACPNYPFCS